MALTYIKKYRVERLKLSINASHSKHGEPLPMPEIERLAAEYDVHADWVRRIERRADIDLQAFLGYRQKMKKAGVDVDASAGERIFIGGKATAKHKGADIRARITHFLDNGLEVDRALIAEEFGLHERSTWPRIILSELEKERSGGEKRPSSPAQRELVIDMLRSMGADFGLPGKPTQQMAAVDQLLDHYSLSQIHKMIKNLYHVQRTAKAMRSDFAKRVVRPFLDAIGFRLFR